jgi:hypothetical protein
VNVYLKEQHTGIQLTLLLTFNASYGWPFVCAHCAQLDVDGVAVVQHSGIHSTLLLT